MHVYDGRAHRAESFATLVPWLHPMLSRWGGIGVELGPESSSTTRCCRLHTTGYVRVYPAADGCAWVFHDHTQQCQRSRRRPALLGDREPCLAVRNIVADVAQQSSWRPAGFVWQRRRNACSGAAAITSARRLPPAAAAPAGCWSIVSRPFVGRHPAPSSPVDCKFMRGRGVRGAMGGPPLTTLGSEVLCVLYRLHTSRRTGRIGYP